MLRERLKLSRRVWTWNIPIVLPRWNWNIFSNRKQKERDSQYDQTNLNENKNSDQIISRHASQITLVWNPINSWLVIFSVCLLSTHNLWNFRFRNLQHPVITNKQSSISPFFHLVSIQKDQTMKIKKLHFRKVIEKRFSMSIKKAVQLNWV